MKSISLRLVVTSHWRNIRVNYSVSVNNPRLGSDSRALLCTLDCKEELTSVHQAIDAGYDSASDITVYVSVCYLGI